MQLLFVHGTLSHYRLSRLIKYSFYKNILFCFMLFFFQFYAGYSGACRERIGGIKRPMKAIPMEGVSRAKNAMLMHAPNRV